MEGEEKRGQDQSQHDSSGLWKAREHCGRMEDHPDLGESHPIIMEPHGTSWNPVES